MEIRKVRGDVEGEEARGKGKGVLNVGFCTQLLKSKKLLVVLEGVQEN
jgi:hypothetical protein